MQIKWNKKKNKKSCWLSKIWLSKMIVFCFFQWIFDYIYPYKKFLLDDEKVKI